MKVLSIILLALIPFSAFSFVKYDEGRIEVEGVQFLQDYDEPTHYYYLPQYPRLAKSNNGNYEMLFMMYASASDPTQNGGVFHALVEFTFPKEYVAYLQEKLSEKVPNAKIVGPVPMQQADSNGKSTPVGFQVLSSVLSNQATNEVGGVQQSLISSGHAPILPGSRAAISAMLNPQNATLLWESFQGNTSDVSIMVNGQYEAAVRDYNAEVRAEASMIYEHFSRVQNRQKGFNRKQMQKITDQLIEDKVIDVSIFDRSKGLKIKTDDMQAIVDLITNKVIELMFDAKSGWAKQPERTEAIESKQIPGRQDQGLWTKFWSGEENNAYITDYQFVLKKRKDVRIHKFYMNLSKETTIQVPFFTTGNLRGFSEQEAKMEAPYFRLVDLDNSFYDSREIHVLLDRQVDDSWSEVINFIQVEVKKEFGDEREAYVDNATFTLDSMSFGKMNTRFAFSLLGNRDEMNRSFRYRTTWGLKGEYGVIDVPWQLESSNGGLSLTPPFVKSSIEVEGDKSAMVEHKYRRFDVRFYTILNGIPKIQKRLRVAEEEAEAYKTVQLFHDKKQPIAYQVTWYPSAENENREIIEEEMTLLEDNFLYIVPK